MSKKRRARLSVVSIVLLLCMVMVGIYAYYIDKDTVVNEFVVGDVDIVLKEPSFKNPTTYIMPKQLIAKDPQVKNVGVNDAFVFVEVIVPCANVETEDELGHLIPAQKTQLFSYEVNDGWVLVETREAANKNTYVYAWVGKGAPSNADLAVLAPGKTTDAVFNVVQFVNLANKLTGSGAATGTPDDEKENSYTVSGTWTFHDVLTAPSNEIIQEIDFSFNQSITDDAFVETLGVSEVQGICSYIRVFPYGTALGGNDGKDDLAVFCNVTAFVPDIASILGEELPIELYAYDELDNDYGWGDRPRTITFDGTQKVSPEFYEWFTANASKTTVTLEAGTYRFNDVLTAPSGEISQDVLFTTDGGIRDDFTINKDVFERWDNILVVPDDGVTVSYIGSADDFDGDVTSVCFGYIGNVGGENIGWNGMRFVAEQMGASTATELNGYGQTITIPTDQEVSAEFAEWFTANAVEDGVQISGKWKFKDEITCHPYETYQVEAAEYQAKINFLKEHGALCEPVDLSSVQEGLYANCFAMGNSFGDMWVDGQPTVFYTGVYVGICTDGEYTGIGEMPVEYLYGQTVDLGNEPQTVSADFYSWLTANAVKQEEVSDDETDSEIVDIKATDIIVNAYAIQTDNINGGKTDPAGVWEVIKNSLPEDGETGAPDTPDDPDTPDAPVTSFTWVTTDIAGKATVEVDGEVLAYKISDLTPAALEGATVTMVDNATGEAEVITLSIEDASIYKQQEIIVVLDVFFVVPTDGYEFFGVTFSEAGIYVLTEFVEYGFDWTLTLDWTNGKEIPRSAPVIWVETVTANTVTLNAISGVEYSADGVHWQDNSTFTGLTLGVEYTFYARYKATAALEASAISSVTVKTQKPNAAPPSASDITVKEVTTNSITLNAVAGAEYSLNGTVWQDSPVFTGLVSYTDYTVYMRYKETDEFNASERVSVKVSTEKIEIVTVDDWGKIASELQEELGITAIQAVAGVQGPGTVDVFYLRSEDSPADLWTQLQTHLEKYIVHGIDHAAAVNPSDFEVLALEAMPYSLTVSASVEPETGIAMNTVTQEYTKALNEYFDSVKLMEDKTIISLDVLKNLLLDCSGVQSVNSLTVNGKTVDYILPAGSYPQLDDLVLE